MRFTAGEVLFRIADLSTLWLIAEVFEQDLALVRPGQRAVITVNAYPERRFEGRVTFVYPTVNPQTRTAQARIELANPGRLLKPEMYASVELEAAAGGPVLSVPASAVLRSGTRDVVLVEVAEGRFQPREVKLGLQSDDRAEVREGLAEGEKVVVSANFLIDAESNLRAALAGFGAPPTSGDSPGAAAPGASAPKAPDPHAGHAGH
jgi:RND family efflux transporter MFP subunit